jgi:HK97 family phage prohead protease
MTVSSPPVAQSGRRAVSLTGIEVRTSDAGDVSVRGHAAVFDSPTMIGPPEVGFEEVIAPGAFRKTIADGADVRLLFNHNPDLVLARTRSGTLSLREDKRGLAVDAQLAPTSVGRDLAVLIQRGDVSQMSFGFRAVKDRWETVTRPDGSSIERRTVLEAQLFDVSSVTYPAYDDTDLAMREATLARELRDVRAAANPDPTEPAPATPPQPDQTPAPDEGDEPNESATPEPAPATPAKYDEVEERSLPLHELLMRHAKGAHRAAPRALCPACTQPAAATA